MRFTTKIFLYIFLTTVIVFGGLTVIIHVWLVNHTLKGYLSDEKRLIHLVAMKSEDYLLRHEYMELHKFFKSTLNVDPYLDYMFTETEDGLPIHTFDEGIPRGLLHLTPIGDSVDMDMVPVENENGDIIYHFRSKIGALPHGVLHAGVSDKKIRDSLIPLRNVLLTAGLLVILLVPLALALFLSKLISRPFSMLRHAVHRIGSGELHYRLSMNAGREIDLLVHDINTMADKLEKLRDGLECEIEERTYTEKNLFKQTELLNEILNHVPHSIFWKDSSLIFIGCNQKYAEAAGFVSPDHIIGKTEEDMPWTRGEKDFFKQCDETVIKMGEALADIEETVTRADGRQRTVITNKVPLKDDDGKLYGILGISYDITERKMMEETIKQTQKMEAIGTLAGGIAHDFNNILSGIIGYSEMAFDETEPGQNSHTYLKQVLKSANRAKELVRQILTFSRKNRDERKPMRLSSIVKDESKLLRSTLPTTIDIRLNVDDKSGNVNADLTQMHQVVMNLCTNAADAMRDTGGVLDISLKAVELTRESIRKYHDISPGPYLELVVSDTGPGIDSRIIHRIFEPFFTTKELEKGTGMGLAVVHGIVKDHGGDIIVESHMGKGTTFTVLLPRVVSLDEAVSETPKKETPTGNERILMIDDEKLLLDLGKRMLESLGYTVTTVSGSLDGLSLFERCADDFDLVVTDQTMPHMTGFELARRMLELRPSTRIILCTGYSDTISPEKVSEAGIKGFFYKPFNKRELAVMIRQALAG